MTQQFEGYCPRCLDTQPWQAEEWGREYREVCVSCGQRVVSYHVASYQGLCWPLDLTDKKIEPWVDEYFRW